MTLQMAASGKICKLKSSLTLPYFSLKAQGAEGEGKCPDNKSKTRNES